MPNEYRMIWGEGLKGVQNIADKVAPYSATVLLLGDSGTGKELVARYIHSRSKRNEMPFVPVECSSIPSNLVESTFFGHEKGAFTDATKTTNGYFGEANGGTIFLDEIGEVTPDLQVKLLRVLQESKYRRVGGVEEIETGARVIAATNQDIEQLRKEGRFRDDLYYRLNVVEIEILPLRRRQKDIYSLAYHFIEKIIKTEKGPNYFVTIIGNPHLDSIQERDLSGEEYQLEVDPSFTEALTDYKWPGNVRELESAVYHAIIMREGNTLRSYDLPARVSGVPTIEEEELLRGPTLWLINRMGGLVEIEKKAILEALQKTNGVVSQAAPLLNMNRDTFRYRMNKHGIDGKKGT
tara:strand:- start:150 stop:1202 length:1053 start_codon:yes stop_codon:yes gene_type:complete